MIKKIVTECGECDSLYIGLSCPYCRLRSELDAHAKTKKELGCMKKSRDEAIGHMDRLQKQLDLIGS